MNTRSDAATLVPLLKIYADKGNVLAKRALNGLEAYQSLILEKMDQLSIKESKIVELTAQLEAMKQLMAGVCEPIAVMDHVGSSYGKESDCPTVLVTHSCRDISKLNRGVKLYILEVGDQNYDPVLTKSD